MLKPRVRYKDGRGEKPLATDQRLQQPQAISQSTLAKMVRGVSCRNYEEVLDTARVSLGVKKSSVSRGFVKASAKELDKLLTRALPSTRPTLCVLDGSKVLASAVKHVFDHNALIQRCQVHKKRNVKAHLPESLHEELDQRLNEAYHGDDYETSRSQLLRAVKWLKGINPARLPVSARASTKR